MSSDGHDDGELNNEGTLDLNSVYSDPGPSNESDNHQIPSTCSGSIHSYDESHGIGIHSDDEACSSGSRSTIDLAVHKYDKPIQPVLNFPSTMFGKAGRSFQKR